MPDLQFKLNGILVPGIPVANRIIHIKISGLQATDGSALNGPIESFYITKFDPFYSNVLRVRFMAGEFLNDVPDATINQLVWYFSNQADLMNYCPERSSLNPKTYSNYRSRWVTAATTYMLLSGTSINGDLQKRLGDLSISRSRAAEELLTSVREELNKLTAILEDGGNYGKDIAIASKGIDHPDAPDLSRQFARSDIYQVEKIPGANVRRIFEKNNSRQTRYKKTWGNK